MSSPLLALLTGTGLGLIALFPGLHFAMLILACGPWFLSQFGPEWGLLGLAWSVVLARSSHTLAVVYHPVAADQIASADPAQKMAARGEGEAATEIMGRSLLTGVNAVLFTLGPLLCWETLTGVRILKPLIGFVSSWLWVALLIWIVALMKRAKHKLGTILILTLSGILGVLALNHPSVRGGANSMTPLLTGLFAIPVLLSTLFENKPSKSATPLPYETEVVHRHIPWLGISVGFLSVGLPGLGTSSLVSLWESWIATDREYLTLSSLAESTGEFFALALGILGLASRSSDAAVIQKVATGALGGFHLGVAFPYWLLAVMYVGAWAGIRLVRVIGPGYRALIEKLPNQVQVVFIGAFMLWVVWHHTGAWGMSIVLAGTLVHLGAKGLGVPNQAFFTCIIAPMVLSMTGINPWGT